MDDYADGCNSDPEGFLNGFDVSWAVLDHGSWGVLDHGSWGVLDHGSWGVLDHGSWGVLDHGSWVFGISISQ